MNSKQALKAASKHIEEMEYSISRYIVDVKAYNACILDMIKGESPCPYCEEHEECQLEAKDGKGCEEWWLMNIPPMKKKEDDDVGEGITGSEKLLLEGATGGEGT